MSKEKVLTLELNRGESRNALKRVDRDHLNSIIMLQQNSYDGYTMPLLMGFTPKNKIQEGGLNEHFIYDNIMQITEYDMRTIGTKCLKSSATVQKNMGGMTKSDKKNEIDDSKQVK